MELGFLKKLASRQSKTDLTSEVFLEKLKDCHLNAWIFERLNILRSFQELFLNFNQVHFKFFEQGKNVVFLKSNGNFGCAIGAKKFDYIVVVFPNLYRLLQSGAPRIGQAILAHELGHLFLGHAERNISPLEAQIEADSFAFHLGYGRELEEILLEQQSLEGQTRLAYLTSLWAEQMEEIRKSKKQLGLGH